MRDRPQPFLAHLAELRRRMTWGAILFGIGFVAAIIFYDPLVRILLLPAHNHLSPNGLPIVTGLTEFMGVTIKMAIIAGFVLALPVFIYQIILFVAPALSPAMARTLFSLLPTTLLLFAAGLCLGYFMVVPTMLRFLLSFGSDMVTPMIRLSDYLSVVLMLLAGLGLAFETPVIMFILTRLKLVSYRGYLKVWRMVVVAAFVMGAIFDPTPNPFDQIVVAGTVISLYFVGIFIAWLMRPQPAVQPNVKGLPSPS